MINNSVRFLETLRELLPGPTERAPRPADDDKFEVEAGARFPPGRENGQERIRKQGRVDSLIWAFRDVGYIYAALNPLGPDYEEHFTNLPRLKEGIFEKLTPEEFGLSAGDWESMFFGGPACSNEKRDLKEILEVYGQIYCGTLGVEFLHIQNKRVRKWFIENLETHREKYALTDAEKKTILEDLIQTEEFENFLNSNYPGQKRFSIEGAEAVIPCLHGIVNGALGAPAREIVLATTHRGRLTILNLVLQMPAEEIFNLFEKDYGREPTTWGGDVKYHLGYAGEHLHPDGSRLRITLPANASHLESVGPVAQGLARGLQENLSDHAGERVIPVVLHGEGAFAGQGVVAETFNLAGLKGYATGGTIHIIVNNQVGFTTSVRDEHSSVFATDIAKAMAIPVLHVNGDDPEAVARAAKLAFDYRRTFHKDAVLDLNCYRKYGHNEGDDPSFTHPKMYGLILRRKSTAALYGERCLARGLVSQAEIEEKRDKFKSVLRGALEKLRARKASGGPPPAPLKIKPFDFSRYSQSGVGIAREEIASLAEGLNAVPAGFHIHEKLKRILENRRQKFKSEGIVDWAFAEALAFGSLLKEGYPVRLSGEDSERGTFSQRHLVWWDVRADEPTPYVPLNHLAPGQAELSVYDSPLSEYSVLGFEYGYSLSRPDALVLWEAQFGDFSNGAQVMIDNYLVAGEAKYRVRSGLVLLLPHGYEGQGPEHSNAYVERWLQAAAQENIQVCNVSTPAQYFCLLRRQAVRRVEKPLVIFTPKSLLRLKSAVSPLDDFVEGRFRFVIDDEKARPERTSRLLFCTGKVYYDLAQKRLALKKDDAAVVRVEQLYPFPRDAVGEVLKKYAAAKEKIWVQEEPRNKGAWDFMRYQLESHFHEQLAYVGRAAAGSPATGSHARHELEQEELVTAALNGEGSRA